MKRYISRSDISINVVLPVSKKNLHITFSPTTSGGSMYYTDNKDIQTAIENHYKFGKLFHVDKSFKKEQEDTPLHESKNSEHDTNLKEVFVSDIEEAKNYLSEKLGVSRTRLRRENDIKAVAQSNGIIFKGI